MKKAALGLALIVIAAAPLAAMQEVSSEDNQMSYQQFNGEIVSYDSEVGELKIRSKVVGDQWVEKVFKVTENTEIYRYLLMSNASAEEEMIEKYVRLAPTDLKKKRLCLGSL